MRAIVRDSYGPPDVLELQEIEQPVATDDEVLVRVRAASANPADWHYLRGLPYIMRPQSGLTKPRDRVLGRDIAGEVEAIGKSVTRFRPGAAVFGHVERGGFAEYASVSEDLLAPKPANVSPEQAAAVPLAGLAALQGLRDAAGVQPGQEVLIIGASGGVGTFAVQIAKHLGARVTGVCSTRNVELVRSLGADEVVDYTRQDFTDGARQWDLILDTAGHRSLSQLRRALTRKGTLVIVGSEGRGRWLGGFDRNLRAVALSRLVGQRLRMLSSKPNQEDLRTLRELAEAGKFSPVIGRSYPLGEVPEAIRQMVQGRGGGGKIVITI